MNSTEIETLVAAIESAFAGVQRGTITLHEAQVMDLYATEAERARANKLDPEDDWMDVSDASIDECPDALPYLDPASWHFYLPACMRYGLRTLHLHRPFDMDQVIYSLAAYKTYPERLQRLNADQWHVVRQFLEFAANNDDLADGVTAEQALDEFWRRDPPD